MHLSKDDKSWEVRLGFNSSLFYFMPHRITNNLTLIIRNFYTKQSKDFQVTNPKISRLLDLLG